MNDIANLITPEIVTFAKVIAALFALIHVLVGLILFRQVSSVNRQVRTPHGNMVTALGAVHILVLAAILVFIIVY